MPDALPEQDALPDAVSSRYRITRLLGRGSLSAVWAAEDLLLQRSVAIKIFNSSAETPLDLERQEAEAKLIASLNHFALTTLFDAGVALGPDGAPKLFLVMEHIPGLDLNERLKHGPLTWSQVSWLGQDLALGLAYLHDAGYLHRDIKPANVLLADREADTRLRGKLGDFGISSLLGSHGDGDSVSGTAAYLSPEQVDGDDPVPASDVYALGLVLLEALTGRTEYGGQEIASAFARLDRQPEVPDSTPEGVAELLRAMTARAPGDRPGTREVADRFQRVLVDDLVDRRGSAEDAAQREVRRLAALQRYNVLTAPPAATFDRVTRLATHLLHVPIATVSIVDADDVWLASRHGIDEQRLDRETAICAGEARTQPWAVLDVTADPRTAALPFVVGEPHVRSYAAAPLVTRDGDVLGSVCAFDVVPRTFTPTDLSLLADLAATVMNELELRLSSRRALFDS